MKISYCPLFNKSYKDHEINIMESENTEERLAPLISFQVYIKESLI